MAGAVLTGTSGSHPGWSSAPGCRSDQWTWERPVGIPPVGVRTLWMSRDSPHLWTGDGPAHSYGSDVFDLLDFEHLIDPVDRKSTRLNSSHANISYAVFCLKKKKNKQPKQYSTQIQN